MLDHLMLQLLTVWSWGVQHALVLLIIPVAVLLAAVTDPEGK